MIVALPELTPVARPLASIVSTLVLSLRQFGVTALDEPFDIVAVAVKFSVPFSLRRSVPGEMVIEVGVAPGDVGVPPPLLSPPPQATKGPSNRTAEAKLRTRILPSALNCENERHPGALPEHPYLRGSEWN